MTISRRVSACVIAPAVCQRVSVGTSCARAHVGRMDRAVTPTHAPGITYELAWRAMEHADEDSYEEKSQAAFEALNAHEAARDARGWTGAAGEERPE